jgi:hypothetical protein
MNFDPKSDRVILTVRVTEEVAEQLEQMAQHDGTSVNRIVNEILERHTTHLALAAWFRRRFDRDPYEAQRALGDEYFAMWIDCRLWLHSALNGGVPAIEPKKDPRLRPASALERIARRRTRRLAATISGVLHALFARP